MSRDDPTTDTASEPPTADDARTPRYEVCVRGRLGTRWAAWFEGMTLSDEGDGTTALRGPVVDQAALHGLLQKLRDLGITLVSLRRLAPGPPVEPPVRNHDQTGHHPPGATS